MRFYCGIDLHSKAMHVCVVDQSGKKLLHRSFKNDDPQFWLQRLEPFRHQDLVVGCESTFNWYWLADQCALEKIPFVLGHALYLKAIHGGKEYGHAISGVFVDQIRWAKAKWQDDSLQRTSAVTRRRPKSVVFQIRPIRRSGSPRC